MFKRAIVTGAFTAAAMIGAGGCGANRYVQRGADLYSEGRYVEADEVFERNEPRVSQASVEDRAAYATYRGATFLALGDLDHAERWLTAASDIERQQPGAMGRNERQFLEGSWQSLRQKRAELSPAPAATAIASSSQAPVQSADLEPKSGDAIQARRSFVSP